MFDWILHNRDVFQMSYVEIGHNYSLAKSLQEEHQKFAVASMNVCVNINRILAVAVRLKEGKFLNGIFGMKLSVEKFFVGSKLYLLCLRIGKISSKYLR